MAPKPFDVNETTIVTLREESQESMHNLVEKISIMVLSVGTLILLASLLRVTTDGPNFKMIKDMLVFLSIVCIILARKRFSTSVVMGALLVFISINASADIFNQGLASTGFVQMTMCCAITGLVFGFQRSLYLLLLYVGIIGFMGVLVCTENSLFPDIEYLKTPQIWISTLVSFTGFTAFMLVTIGSVQNRLSQSLHRVKVQSRKLEEHEHKYRQLAENSQDVLLRQDLDLNIIYASPSVERLFGYSPQEIMNIRTDKLMKPESRKKAERLFKDYFELSRVNVLEDPLMEFEYLNKNGSSFWGELNPTFLRNEEGDVIGFQSVLRDITVRKEAEKTLRSLLEEKEVLLRELYHRTKNNMQVVSSMLSLQSKYVKDKASIKIFNDLQNRINAMSLIHQKLYQSKNLSSINFREYIEELVSMLQVSYNKFSVGFSVNVNTEKTDMSIDTAIPCGLIINELVSNSLKHAFPGDKTGMVKIEIDTSREGKTQLTVSDDGAGVPADFDITTNDSFGIKIISAIGKRQLKGDVEFDTSKGISCRVRFNSNAI